MEEVVKIETPHFQMPKVQKIKTESYWKVWLFFTLLLCQ